MSWCQPMLRLDPVASSVYSEQSAGYQHQAQAILNGFGKVGGVSAHKQKRRSKPVVVHHQSVHRPNVRDLPILRPAGSVFNAPGQMGRQFTGPHSNQGGRSNAPVKVNYSAPARPPNHEPAGPRKQATGPLGPPNSGPEPPKEQGENREVPISRVGSATESKFKAPGQCREVSPHGITGANQPTALEESLVIPSETGGAESQDRAAISVAAVAASSPGEARLRVPGEVALPWHPPIRRASRPKKGGSKRGNHEHDQKLLGFLYLKQKKNSFSLDESQLFS